MICYTLCIGTANHKIFTVISTNLVLVYFHLKFSTTTETLADIYNWFYGDK